LFRLRGERWGTLISFFRIIILLTFTAFPAAQACSEETPRFSDQKEPQILAESLVDAMSDREALGQVLMFGYPGTSPDDNLLSWIAEADLGSVKIFGWNAVDLPVLADTIKAYQETALNSRLGIPLFIATDQEGGWVRHIKGNTSLTPGNMALGADRLPYDAWMTGLLLGRELSAVGVNMNFAPTVDLFVNPEADVIGPRAFMADPEWTGILGLSFFKGQAEAGIVSSAKHFPGHGDTRVDSHGTLPVINADMETLWNRDLIPYKTMISGGVPAIMVGHLAFPSITGEVIPATLSHQMITGLLKETMGFQGVAITDDLFMRGARTDGDPLPDVCYRALSAGADLLLISQGPQDQREIHRYLQTKMQDPSFNLRVRDAARRVVTLKAEYLKRPDAVPFHPDSAELRIPTLGAESFFLEQASRSITLIGEERFPIPSAEAGKVLLAGTYEDFFREGIRRYPDALRWRLTYSSTDSSLRKKGQDLLRTARDYDTVIVLLPDEKMGILLNELKPLGDKVVVISVLSPVHLDDMDWVRTSLAAYGTGPESFRAAFAALAGDFTPEGILPIPLKVDQ